MKKPVVVGEEHPPPTVNAPALKEPTAAGEGHPAVKQLVEAVGKKPAEEHPAGTKERHAKQSAASGHSHPWQEKSPSATRSSFGKEKNLPSPVPIVSASASRARAQALGSSQGKLSP
ncbi:hypothetical protein B296_00053610 [Ensete ventricosum]|uniref:Uncharacterized protein n=1 Tax=Ensete ventricosum TaxID=4639 RepID=A0A426X433_ENSVE|nr:hypothetical protein B296_00053610 [Ensete ventricosum]